MFATEAAGGYAADEKETVVQVPDKPDQKALPRSAQISAIDGMSVGEQITLSYAFTAHSSDGALVRQYVEHPCVVQQKTAICADVRDTETGLVIHLPCRCHGDSHVVVVDIRRGSPFRQQLALEWQQVFGELSGYPNPLDLDSVATFLRAGEWRLVLSRVEDVVGLRLRPRYINWGPDETLLARRELPRTRSDNARTRLARVYEAALLCIARDVKSLPTGAAVSSLYAGDASRRYFTQSVLDAAALHHLEALGAPVVGYQQAMEKEYDRTTAYEAALRSRRPPAELDAPVTLGSRPAPQPPACGELREACQERNSVCVTPQPTHQAAAAVRGRDRRETVTRVRLGTAKTAARRRTRVRLARVGPVAAPSDAQGEMQTTLGMCRVDNGLAVETKDRQTPAGVNPYLLTCTELGEAVREDGTAPLGADKSQLLDGDGCVCLFGQARQTVRGNDGDRSRSDKVATPIPSFAPQPPCRRAASSPPARQVCPGVPHRPRSSSAAAPVASRGAPELPASLVRSRASTQSVEPSPADADPTSQQCPLPGPRAEVAVNDGAGDCPSVAMRPGSAPAPSAGKQCATHVVQTRPAFPGVPIPGPMFDYDDEPDVEADEPVVESGEGALVRIRQLGGGRRKLNPADRTTDLVLAETTTNLIRQDVLIEDAEHFKEVFAPIRSAREFSSLFIATSAPLTKHRPLSRGMLKHEDDLCRFDILEPVEWVADQQDIIDTALAVYLFTWITLFTVAKKNGKGRLIGDARPINERQRRPDDMGLPAIHDVIRTVLTYSHAAKTDGVSYFYQFEIAPEVRPFFKVRLAGARGDIREYMFKRLPMGWKFSPRIAQQTSNFLVRNGVGVAWLDDFIIGGKDLEEFTANRSTFLERLERYNVEVDNTELEPTQLLEALGLQFDLTEHMFRLDPQWVEKRTPRIDTFVADTTAGRPVSYRTVFETFGTLIWAAHVRSVPLWTYAEAMNALRQAARSCAGDYDANTHLAPFALKNLRDWVSEVKTNEWMVPPQSRPKTFDHFVFSDASDVGQAFMEVIGDTVQRAEAWRRSSTEHIFLAELDALATGAEATIDTPLNSKLFVTDNTTTHYILRRGTSSSYPAEVRCRQAFGREKPWSCWIPTHLMPADGMSRGDPPPEVPCKLTPAEQAAVTYCQQDAFGDPRNRSETCCALQPSDVHDT